MNSLQALLEVLVLGLLSELHTSVFVHRVQKCWACPVNYVRGKYTQIVGAHCAESHDPEKRDPKAIPESRIFTS